MKTAFSALIAALVALCPLPGAATEPAGPAVATPEMFQAVGDGSADDGPALAAAFQKAEETGEEVVLTRRYHYSASLRVPAGVLIRGVGSVGGAEPGDDYGRVRPALVPDQGASLRVERNVTLRNFAIVSAGLPQPTSYREVASTVKGWTGTAIEVGRKDGARDGADDVTIEDLFIIGFGRCIAAEWAARLQIFRVKGECENGIAIDQSHDVSRIADTHFWPFYVQGNLKLRYASKILDVQRADDSHATITLEQPHQLAPGDVVALADAKGLAGVLRSATVVAAPDTHHIEVSGLPDGQFAGGALRFLPGLEHGTAYSIEHSEGVNFIGNYSYGFLRHVYCGPGSEWVQFFNQGIDGNLLAADPASVGYDIEGDADRILVSGGLISGVAQTALINSSSPRAAIFSNVSINRSIKGVFAVSRGRLTVQGGDIASAAPSFVADAAAGLTLDNVAAANLKIAFQSEAARAKFSMRNDLAR